MNCQTAPEPSRPAAGKQLGANIADSVRVGLTSVHICRVSCADKMFSNSHGGLTVMEYMHPVLIKGNYQVVALTREQEYDPGEVTAYAVLNSTGARLRQDLSLEEARIWVDTLIEEEKVLRADDPPVRAKPMRRKR